MNEEKASQEKELSIEVEFNDIFDITVAEDFRLKLVDALNNAQAIKLLASKIERADKQSLNGQTISEEDLEKEIEKWFK